MPTKQSLIQSVLEASGANVYYIYPACWSDAPVISWRESDNRCFRRADGMEFLTELSYVVDVWAKNPADAAALAQDVDTRMTAAKFKRSFMTDLFEKSSRYYHRNIHYRCIVDSQGNMYQ